MECAGGDSDGVPPDIVGFLTVSLMLVHATHVCNAYYVALAQVPGSSHEQERESPSWPRASDLKAKGR